MNQNRYLLYKKPIAIRNDGLIMNVPNITSKQQLVLNELIFKYNLNYKFSRNDILELHEELIGNLKESWYRKYTEKDGMAFRQISEIFATLIYPLAHPALRVLKDKLQEPGSFYWNNRIRPHLDEIKKVSFSIGRLTKVDKKGHLIPTATGVRLGEDLFLTVSKPFAEQGETFKGIIKKEQYRVDFSEDRKVPGQEEMFEIKDFINGSNNPRSPLSLLILKKQSLVGKKLPPPLELANKKECTEFLVTIGYPIKKKNRSNHLLTYATFGSSWQMGYKRIAPGHVLRNEDTKIYHDCSTSSGSEGSPLINPKTGKVMGVHLYTKEKSKNIACRSDYHFISALFDLSGL